MGRIATEALLFQTGYLSIRNREDRGGKPFYRLGYPNREVGESLNESLLDCLSRDDPQREANSMRLYDLLQAADFAGLKKLFHALFASIPHEWHNRNPITRYKGYYASVFFSYFAGLGLDVTVEDSSSRGPLDIAVRAAGRVYLFKFKVLESAGSGAAMFQLRERGYAEKCRHLGEQVHLVAVECSSEARNLAGFEEARA